MRRFLHRPVVAAAQLRPALVAVPVLAVLVLTVFFSGCGATPTPSDSGVQGEVRVGPINPVEQPGVTNDRPYVATLRVKRASDGKVVAETKSAADGSFRLPLPPGRYILEPVNGSPLPVAPLQEFAVEAGRFTTVDVSYDSGIR
jgi:hypothetical protein